MNIQEAALIADDVQESGKLEDTPQELLDYLNKANETGFSFMKEQGILDYMAPIMSLTGNLTLNEGEGVVSLDGNKFVVSGEQVTHLQASSIATAIGILIEAGYTIKKG